MSRGEPRGIGYWAVSHLESCQASTMEPLYEGGQRLYRIDYISQKPPSQIFVWIPNVPLIVGVVNGG